MIPRGRSRRRPAARWRPFARRQPRGPRVSPAVSPGPDAALAEVLTAALSALAPDTCVVCSAPCSPLMGSLYLLDTVPPLVVTAICNDDCLSAWLVEGS